MAQRRRIGVNLAPLPAFAQTAKIQRWLNMTDRLFLRAGTCKTIKT